MLSLRRTSFLLALKLSTPIQPALISKAQVGTMGEAHNPASSKKKSINLLKGWPNASLLPAAAIAKASAAALADPTISTPALCYGPDPGYEPLREEIAKWLAQFYPDPGPSSSLASHVPVGRGAERICITGGASQNLACVLQTFTDPIVTRVWMVAPCYFLACRIFEDNGLRCRAVGEGKDGIDLELLKKMIMVSEKEDEGLKALKRPKPWSKIYRHIIYLVPTFSNPSGKTMPLSQREDLIRLAREHDALVVTDDVYDSLQWLTTPPTPTSAAPTRAPVPRLVDVDRTLAPVPAAASFGNAVSNGSFSKIVGPGVRTGWAEGTPTFAYGLSQTGSSRSGGAPSQLVATFIAELLRSGELQAGIAGVLCPAYRKRYEVTIAAVRAHLLPLGVRLGEVSFGEEAVFGGYFIWLELPDHIHAQMLAERALAEENLVIAPGYIFEVQGDKSVTFDHSVRLSFSWEEEEDLEEGVRRLANVIARVGKDGKGGVGEIGGPDKAQLKQDMGKFQ